ncbi:MAG: F420-0:Gamma-glutamyl ligase [Firmicutes bacterium]|nr:F420-0:Gamma-glutamyl ligase [Bacillota bacterium]
MAVKIPLRTHLITEHDDIVQVTARYAGRLAEPADLIAVAESVVAISQGRFYRQEDIKTGFIARFLCRFPQRHGSLTSAATIQLAINEVGIVRILLAAAAGAIGRILTVPGFFYRIAGPAVALIDDVAGTMHPYHDVIVLGPEKADQVAQAISDCIGIDAVVMDANDLGKADVVGASSGVPRHQIPSLFFDNPAGNYEQQTPLLLIKNYRSELKGVGTNAA